MSNQSKPITLQEAQILAQKALDQIGTPGEMVVDSSKTLEHDFGWFFKADTVKYLESGDPKYRIPGVGLIAVDRNSRHTQFLPTFMPPERAMEEYIERWKEKQ